MQASDWDIYARIFLIVKIVKIKPILIIIGLFYSLVSFGQQDTSNLPRTTRFGLGAIGDCYGLKVEGTIERDVAQRLYVVGRFATSFAESFSFYTFRSGLHYKLLQFRRSYLSVGSEFRYSNIKFKAYNNPSTHNEYVIEFPVRLNIALNKYLMLEVSYARSIPLRANPVMCNDGGLSFVRFGIKYNMY